MCWHGIISSSPKCAAKWKGKIPNGEYRMFSFHFFKGGKCICKYLLVSEYMKNIKEILFWTPQLVSKLEKLQESIWITSRNSWSPLGVRSHVPSHLRSSLILFSQPMYFPCLFLSTYLRYHFLKEPFWFFS